MSPASITIDQIYFDAAPDRKVKTTPQGQAPSCHIEMHRGCIELEHRARPPNRGASAATRAPMLPSSARSVKVQDLQSSMVTAITSSVRTPTKTAPRPSWLLRIDNVDLITNAGKPFIPLSMTCYTAQFAKPADAGTVDELLHRPNGGAVAVWGPGSPSFMVTICSAVS